MNFCFVVVGSKEVPLVVCLPVFEPQPSELRSSGSKMPVTGSRFSLSRDIVIVETLVAMRLFPTTWTWAPPLDCETRLEVEGLRLLVPLVILGATLDAREEGMVEVVSSSRNMWILEGINSKDDV